MSDFQDCIVSYVDLNNVGTLMRQKGAHGVRAMRTFHQLVSNHAHTLTAHDEVCFWQDSVLLLAPVDSTEKSYQLAMNDVLNLKETIQAFHPCHAVSVKGQSFPPPIPPKNNPKPRTIYLAASSLAFSNCFKIEEKLKHRKGDWYIDQRIIAKIKARHSDYSDPVVLLPGNSPRKIHVYFGSFR